VLVRRSVVVGCELGKELLPVNFHCKRWVVQELTRLEMRLPASKFYEFQ
jgi:hypothetical protein